MGLLQKLFGKKRKKRLIKTSLGSSQTIDDKVNSNNSAKKNSNYNKPKKRGFFGNLYDSFSGLFNSSSKRPRYEELREAVNYVNSFRDHLDDIIQTNVSNHTLPGWRSIQQHDRKKIVTIIEQLFRHSDEVSPVNQINQNNNYQYDNTDKYLNSEGKTIKNYNRKRDVYNDDKVINFNGDSVDVSKGHNYSSEDTYFIKRRKSLIDALGGNQWKDMIEQLFNQINTTDGYQEGFQTYDFEKYNQALKIIYSARKNPTSSPYKFNLDYKNKTTSSDYLITRFRFEDERRAQVKDDKVKDEDKTDIWQSDIRLPQLTKQTLKKIPKSYNYDKRYDIGPHNAVNFNIPNNNHKYKEVPKQNSF